QSRWEAEILLDSPRRREAEMGMTVDQTGEHRLARSLDDLGVWVPGDHVRACSHGDDAIVVDDDRPVVEHGPCAIPRHDRGVSYDGLHRRRCFSFRPSRHPHAQRSRRAPPETSRTYDRKRDGVKARAARRGGALSVELLLRQFPEAKIVEGRSRAMFVMTGRSIEVVSGILYDECAPIYFESVRRPCAGVWPGRERAA